MTETVCIIPARMGSTRFPGKPLASILGKPMIQHVYENSKKCSLLSEVYVATCDDEIRDMVESFGGKVIMTSDRHVRATDRVAEAAQGLTAEIIVMVQGDEPMVHPEMIEEALAGLYPSAACVNLTKSIDSALIRDRNTIKVAMDIGNDALWFSREPISTFKQVCVIPFWWRDLGEYLLLEPATGECYESVDMLRFLENGYRIHMVETQYDTHAVDTPEDLVLVEGLMKARSLTGQPA